MKTFPSLLCPSCQSPTEVREIHCANCDCQVRAHFAPNEFAFLEGEDLHFLRMFLQFEGRIRDMEAPLGLSYPTIRTRLSRLKEKVLGANVLPETEDGSTEALLEDLNQGKANFEETLKKIKNRKRGKS